MPLCLSIPDAGSPAGRVALLELENGRATSSDVPWEFVSLRYAAADLLDSVGLGAAGELDWQTSALSCGAIELICPTNRDQLYEAARSACTLQNACNTAAMIVEFASPYAEELSREELQRLNQLAHDRQIQISVDVAGPRDSMRRRMEDILTLPERRLGVAVDTGNYLIANPTSSIEVMLLRNIHQLDAIVLRDAPAEVSGNSPGTVLPLGGDGLIDYARAAQIILGIAFAGPCVIDLSANVGGSSDIACWLDHPHVVDAVEHLRICGWFPQGR